MANFPPIGPMDYNPDPVIPEPQDDTDCTRCGGFASYSEDTRPKPNPDGTYKRVLALSCGDCGQTRIIDSWDVAAALINRSRGQ